MRGLARARWLEGFGIRLHGLFYIRHVLFDVLMVVDIRLGALLRVYHMLFDIPFLPWALEDQMENVADEQSDQGNLRRHAEDADEETDIETQC